MSSFPRIRNARLQNVLSDRRLKDAWKKSVRHGLRNQALQDLHDYLDVHRNITSLVERIRNDVARGTFRPREFEVITQEKRLGVCRRLVIPSAVDAIVLQALVDFIEPILLRGEPTDSAYYGRSHQPPSVHDVDDSFAYVWWKLWPEFQERIWEFSDKYDYVVFTDVANYFDAIPLGRLRNRLASIGRFDEEVLDLLFYLVEAFVWRPDFIPFSGTGLPQIDFDAPRLLAHTYLYEIDRLLKHETQTEFVRWMDDIDFGAGSLGEAKAVLSQVDLRLGSLGLRVNMGKSAILPAQQALHHLWIRENRRLTLLSKLLANAVNPVASRKRIAAYAEMRFKIFYKASPVGAWEKVLKRYVTLFRRTTHMGFDRWAEEVLINFPSVRPWVLDYLAEVGYSPARFRMLERFLLDGHCVDDTSRFKSCRVLAEWSIPLRSPTRGRCLTLAKKVGIPDATAVSGFAGGLWLMAKHGSPPEVGSYLQDSRHVWIRSEWGGRQVAAVTPLLSEADRTVVVRVIRKSGLLDALGVLANVEAVQNLEKMHTQIWDYLTYPMEPYPFPKAILARAVLDGSLEETGKTQLRRELDALVADDVLRKRIGL